MSLFSISNEIIAMVFPLIPTETECVFNLLTVSFMGFKCDPFRPMMSLIARVDQSQLNSCPEF